MSQETVEFPEYICIDLRQRSASIKTLPARVPIEFPFQNGVIRYSTSGDRFELKLQSDNKLLYSHTTAKGQFTTEGGTSSVAVGRGRTCIGGKRSTKRRETCASPDRDSD